MLSDRVCVAGGWNAGNSVVHGGPLRPHVEATAIALLALQDENRSVIIDKSLEWLKLNAASIDAATSLAWCILSLFAYQEPVDGLKNRLATIIGNGRDPRRTSENRPYVDTSKPANGAEPGQKYLYLGKGRFGKHFAQTELRTFILSATGRRIRQRRDATGAPTRWPE